MKSLITIFSLAIAVVQCGCSNASTSGSQTQTDYFFSFENGLEGWTAFGIDLLNPSVVWSIEPTGELKSEGEKAVKFYLANFNDASKIWLERSFSVKPDRKYLVRVSYAFASADYGDIGAWRLITGVQPSPPRKREELTYQGLTSNGSETDVGFSWKEKQFELSAMSDAEGRLCVFIGVWGTWETKRTYYIDAIRIAFEE